MSKVLVAICGLIVAVLGFIQFEQTNKGGPATSGTVGQPLAPGACLQGFVWRLAFAGDHVCVTPDEHEEVVQENQLGLSRVDPNGAYGPDSCIDGHGWVWRDARPGDHVCVTGAQRDEAAHQNAEGPSRAAQ